MLFVDVPCAMSFRTLCLPCGVCRPRYALRIFRPTIPSTYASPRAVSLVVFTDMAIVRREISSSISYTAQIKYRSNLLQHYRIWQATKCPRRPLNQRWFHLTALRFSVWTSCMETISSAFIPTFFSNSTICSSISLFDALV